MLWEAGVPREALRLVKVTDRDAGSKMIAHPAVDRLILTGGYETAEMFRSWRKDLPSSARAPARTPLSSPQC